MIRPVHCFVFVCLLSTSLVAQQAGFSTSNSGAGSSGGVVVNRPSAAEPLKPFSRVALGAGIGIMGINLQAATNLHPNLNLRASGNVFNYTVDDIESNGFTANGKLDLASAGVSLDYYPWARHGFRLSPGVLFYNQNSLSATAVVADGESFTLNHVDYYSSASDPIRAKAKVGLNVTNPAFTVTTGWGNIISRKGGHWSFPFELGAAFVGSPSFDMTVSGTACDSTREYCVDSATDPDVQSNLQSQIAKYKKDVDPLKVYPILSFGISYNFSIGTR